ncbi:hypothetical protein LQZ19_08585 [Treponema primitia]|uniref:hypothetical protein n=1 Tax=Treponema primitia TaxID=88058 RepID=UPI003980D8AD
MGEMIELLDNDRFIVINQKRFDELNEKEKTGPDSFFQSSIAVLKVYEALNNFSTEYEKSTGKKLNQKYIVCNQDEPYAEEVARIILEGEKAKLKEKG